MEAVKEKFIEEHSVDNILAKPAVEDAVVDLEDKTVTITGNADIAAVKQAIRDADYEVVD